ncbi:MAG: alginate export family protein [Bryobacterales bacterium]
MRIFVLAALFLGQAFAQAQVDRGPLNRDLPKWLTLGVTQRIRGETWGDVQFNPSDDDTFLVNRLQVRATIRPARNVTVFAEAMDSRVNGLTAGKPRPNLRDPIDLRQGYIRFGQPNQGHWDLTVGRQELVFGEERQLGINQWANLPRSWDAVRLGLHQGVDRVDIFAASVVTIDTGGFNTVAPGSNIHGVYGQLRSPLPGHVIEPHVFWRTRPLVTDERGFTGDSDIFTLGARVADDHDLAIDYDAELETQWGHYAQDQHRGVQAMGRVGYTFTEARWAPHLFTEYTFSSGDKERGDGRSGRYDQIYARAHRIWGIVDQVGGRNSKIWQQGVQWRPAAAWQFRVDHLFYWLANPHDNLYRHNGRLFLSIPAGNRETYIGDEAEAQLVWRPAPEITLGVGFGKLFSGSVIKRYSQGGSPMLGFAFAQLTL